MNYTMRSPELRQFIWEIRGDAMESSIGSQSSPPEAIAPVVIYLATEETAYISGAVWAIQGGHVALYSGPAELITMDKREGWWTVDELAERVPKALLEGYRNLAAAAQP